MDTAKRRGLVALLVTALALALAVLLFQCFPLTSAHAETSSVTTAEQLTEAVDDSTCGEITLGADIKQSITIPEGRTLTLDLNGHTLTNSEGGHTVTNYGTLTIKDGSAGSNGAVDNISGGRGALVNYGTATVNSGSIVRGEDAQGSWYVIKNYGYMTLGKDADSPVKVDTNSDGSSLIANGYYDAADKEANAESITVTENACTLVVNGGTYTNGMNTVKNDNDGVLTINNGSFTNKYEAGSVVMSAGKLTIADGIFTQTNSSAHGVRITTSGDAVSAEIKGGTFGENADVYLMHELEADGTLDVKITGGNFAGDINAYTLYGSAVTATDKLTVTGGTFGGGFALGYDMNVSLEGGDYTVIPSALYRADNVKVYEYTDSGKYVLVSTEESAPAGTEQVKPVTDKSGKGFDTLAEALAQASSSSYYFYLQMDIKESVELDTLNRNVYIYLDGNTWIADGDKPALTYGGAKTLYITATKGVNGGSIERTTAGPVIVNSGNKIYFNNASSGEYTVKNAAEGDYALIENKAGGVIDITSGSFESAGYLFKNFGEIEVSYNAKGKFNADKDIVLGDAGTLNIMGGTYNKQPTDVDPEYAAVKNDGEETWTVLPVAVTVTHSDGTTDIITEATLIELDSKIGDGDTVKLYDAVKGSGGISIAAGETVTIDVNGEEFNDNITNSGTLTFTGSAASGSVSGNITNNAGGTITFEGGRFSGDITNNGVEGAVTIRGGAFGYNASVVRTAYAFLDEGYYFTSRSSGNDGYFTVEQAEAEIEVTDGDVVMNFGSFSAAVGYATYDVTDPDSAQVTLKLLKNVQLSSYVTFGRYVGGAKTWIVDLNGKTITSSQKSFSTIGNNSSYPTAVTIKNGNIVISTDGSAINRAILIKDGSTLTLDGVNTTYDATTQPENLVYVESNATLKIFGGSYYNGKIATEDKTASVTVSGGTFDTPIADEYLADGKVMTQVNGKYTVVDASVLVTGANDTNDYYASLADAFSAAEDGDVITLLTSVDNSGTETFCGELSKDISVTLDLNENTVTAYQGVKISAGKLTVRNGVISTSDRVFQVSPTYPATATLILEDNLSIESKSSGGVVLLPSGNTAKSDDTYDPIAFLISEADITSHNTTAAIIGGGNDHGTSITINGGIVKTDFVGDSELAGEILHYNGTTTIYNPQYGEVIVNGGEIIGGTGIEMRAGKLVVNGGTITSTAAFQVIENGNDNGATTLGSAVTVAQHGTKLPLSIEIKGGKLIGESAFYQANLQNNPEEAVAKVSASIVGGTFDGAVTSENLTGFISGGSFTSAPDAALLGEGLETAPYGDAFVVVPEAASEDPADILNARLEAQSAFRSYAVSCGMTLNEINALAEAGSEQAAAVVAAYDNISSAGSTGTIAIARMEAMDALDALLDAIAAELDEYKQSAIAEIDKSAANGDVVVVPTATYAAIMNAASEAEVDMYKANALKEITDVRAYRAEVTAMTDKLGDIETAVTALGGALGGDNDYIDAMLSDIRSAISSASEEIIDGTSTSLAAACASIEAKIAESEKMITTAMTEMLETMRKDIDGLESAISGGSADTDKLESALAELGTKLESVIADNRTAYEAALEETGSELKAAIAAIEADVEKLAGSVGSLADGEDVSALAGDIAEVSEVLATITSQLDGVAEGSAFAPVYVLCGISLALAAAAVVLLVLLLIKRK